MNAKKRYRFLGLTAIKRLWLIWARTVDHRIGKTDDDEPNIRWETAVALAKMDDVHAIPVIKELLQRDYLRKFKEVDDWEQVQALLVAVHVSGILKSDEFIPFLEKLALEDLNMKVRDSAIKTLKKVYNKDVG